MGSSPRGADIAVLVLLPAWPNAPVPIITLKHGDVGVHLAAISAFLLVGLMAERGRWLPTAALWAAWFVDLAIVGAINRAAMLSAAMGGSAILFVRSSQRMFQGAAIAVFFFASLYLVNPVVDLGGNGRNVSFSQLVSNATSVLSDTGDPALDNNKEWRLAWWNTIIDYTFRGPYFWTGKGFGINLADADGFQVLDSSALRAPHNGHLEILARSGVPGLALWVLFQVGFGLGLLKAAGRAWKTKQKIWLQATAWVFAYWTAALLDMSFDVYLDGPHGGILVLERDWFGPCRHAWRPRPC